MSAVLPGYLQRAATGLILLRPGPDDVEVVDANRAAATLLDFRLSDIANGPLSACQGLGDATEICEGAVRVSSGDCDRWQTEVNLGTSARRRAEVILVPAGELGEGFVLAEVVDRTRERHLREQLGHAKRITRSTLEEAISGYLSSASHELRTPLSSVVACVEVLLEGGAGPLTDAQHDLLSSVERNSRRLQNLVIDLLGLARADAESLVLGEGVPLVEVVEGTLTALEQAMTGRGITVDVRCPHPSPVVRGERPQLDRLAHHLLSYAIAATPDSGRFTVDLRTEGRHSVLVVAASRQGPAPDSIGLSVARSIVSTYGGTFVHEPTGDGGSSLTVRLGSASVQSAIA